MLEQVLKDIWNNSSQTERISIEANSLVEELKIRVNNIQKKIRRRAIKEISTSVIGILIFGYLMYEIPFPIKQLACFFLIIWFAFVILKSRKSKQQNTTTHLSLSMTEQLDQQENAMRQQAIFLNSAAYWYSIPSFIINCIFIFGLGNPADYNWTNLIAENILPLTFSFKIITLAGLAFFYGFTIWINKRAANKGIKPLLESLRNMQKQLKNE